MRIDRLPLTYDECRARFRREAADAQLPVAAHPISARGPFGQELTIDIAVIGAPSAKRTLLILSGVHGVEGFVNSTLQTDLLGRVDGTDLPDDVAIVLVHAVNPWGMAHGRRQNESNVDLNRNWRRSDTDPDHNLAYDELHALACPDTATLPAVDDLLGVVGPVIERHGLEWVKDGITKGQYRYDDGLHFGGHETEESCRVLEREIPRLLGSAGKVFTVDLHTGVGPRGQITLLSSQPSGSYQDAFLVAGFGNVDAAVGADGPGSTVKSGAIAAGIADLLPEALCFALTPEFGTASDLEQLTATYQEQWVHRLGSLAEPAHAAARRRYRECFTPDDPDWEAAAMTGGRRLLDDAIAAVASWT